MIKSGVLSSATIPHGKIIFLVLGLLGIAILIGTGLRVSLLIIYPFVALALVLFYGLRPSGKSIILLGLAFVSFIFSFLNGTFLGYKMLSLYYMVPFLVLVFAHPPPVSRFGDLFRYFIICTASVALLNDVIGFFQVVSNPNSDDSFLGLYSQYSISLNGLVLINSLLFFYFFVKGLYRKSITSLIMALFFLLCFVFGFYGAGLVVCAVAFIFSFLRFRLLSVLKTLGVGVLLIVALYFTMLLIKPYALEYNIANLTKLASLDLEYGPRKIISFYNYCISYPKDVKDFLLGSGPGTFNSRSAFMIGSPSYFQTISFIKSDQQPYYFKNYAYSLWNERNTVKELYLDGFRNQPFSSLLAFLGEYGLIFTFALILLYYSYYKKVALIYRALKRDAEAEIAFRFFKYLIVLLPLLLVIDNFFEYPEIILLISMGIKFSHAQLLHLYKLKVAL